jgi:hypothetical protein
MKKILFFGFLLAQLLSSHAQTSKYMPFPSNMISYGYINQANSDKGWYSVYRMEIKGDTIINGIPYSKYYLAQKNEDGAAQWPSSDPNGFVKIAGGIRNDVSTKKVYLYSINTQKEQLLYDFDLHVGDTLFKNTGYGFYSSILSRPQSAYIKIDTVWVSRVDSILMPHDGLYHKRFNFNATFRDSKRYHISSDSMFKIPGLGLKINPLIEGIGEPYNPVSIIYGFEYEWILQPHCISIDGKTVYKSSSTSPPPFLNSTLCNSIITAVNESKEDQGVTLFPNPSNGKFELLTYDLKNSSFEISNILGTTILKSKIESGKTEIDLTPQPTGIYFIRIYAPTGLIMTKKIVIN